MQSLPWTLPGLALGFLSVSGMAQTATDRAINDSDIRRAEQSRLGAATSQEPGGWDIEINLPLYWSSNAVQLFGDQSSVAGSPKSDWHVTPDALLRYTYQFDWVKVSAKLDVGEDRYFQQITVNQDAIFATLKAEFTDGRSDLFVPYVAYTPEVDFLPFFAHWQDTLQDFYGGFTSGFGIKSGKPVEFRDAVDPGDLSVLVDVRAGQRLASPKGFENTFFRVSADFIYVATPELSLWLTAAYRFRHYPDFFGDRRHDNRLSAIAKAVWTPDWLTRHVKNAEIDFEVAWYKNYSNLSFEQYTVWEVGPAVLLAWHF
jgi:hypothetical protein